MNLGKSHHLTDNKNTPKRAVVGAKGPFLIFWTSCIYLDGVKLDASNFTSSCNVAG